MLCDPHWPPHEQDPPRRPARPPVAGRSSMSTTSRGGGVATPNRRSGSVAAEDHRSSSESSARHRQDSGARRRRQASQRLAPLASGTRDPWAARAGAEAVAADPYSALTLKRMSDRSWRAACARLHVLAEDGERHKRNRADLLRHRAGDYMGREQHDLEAAA